MTKERRFWFSLVLCFAAAVPLLLGACLNPVDFSAENLPRIPVDVSGSIDVTIKDVAVFWLINRTKDVDVTTLKIDRAKGDNETDAQYAYPKTYSERPKAGSSLASYHNPTDLFYTVEAAYINTNTQEIGVINALEVQFPRVGDYKYYLYWDKNGNLQLVDENKMNELPPDPTKNYPDPGPNPVDSSYTMVVLNVTRDQNIDSVEFEQSSYTYAISNEPRAKDQEMIYLGAGSYDTYVSYTKDAQVKKIGPKTAVVTSEGGSMAVRTNFLYFYKTIAGDYAVSQTWPPIPNDASDENSPEDALGDNQGILQIINNAVPNNPHALIARININGVDYPDSTNTSNYMGPGESKKFILPVGTAEVLFKPVDQTFYGQLSKRTIESKKTTTLYYVNDMGNPFEFPPDEGNGSGLIQIINNSYGVVTSAVIYNKDELTKYLSFGYNEFVPSGPINNGAMGLIPVLGTDEVELKSGELQLIQIALETNEGVVVLERLASLNGRIVTITINQNDLKLGGDDEGGRYGSKVTVTNSTQSSTNILGMYVYNKANAAASAVYYLDIASPPQNSSKSLYVLSTLGLPILDGEHYEAQLSVYGNGRIALIKKQFSPDDLLYSKTPDAHVRTITLQEADLPAELKENFVPVTGMTSNYSELTSYYDTDGSGNNALLKLAGALNLNHSVTITPNNASKQSPINWVIGGAGAPYVSLDPSTSVLTVTGIPTGGGDVVLSITAKIEAAAGTALSKTDFTKTFNITLKYQKVGVRTQPVTGIGLTDGTVQANQTLDLRSLATLNPAGVNIDGVPITKDDLVWYINGSPNSGSIYNAPSSPGTVLVYAVLPADKNGGTQKTSSIQTITITPTPVAFVPVTGVTWTTGSSSALPYYTKTIGTGPKDFVQGSSLNLSASVTVSPQNATVQTITWSPVSLPSNVTLNAGVLTVNGIPNSSTGRVKATIAGGISNGGADFSVELSFTLVEHHSRLLAPGGELTVGNGNVEAGKTLDLLSLVTKFPSDLYIDLPGNTIGLITKDDLIWTLSSGTGASINGSTLSATAAGSVTVTATLPAAKNGGTAVSDSGTVTITAPTPSTFTLRIIKVPTIGDGVTKVVLVPTTWDPGNETVYQTGYSGRPWADTRVSGKFNGTYDSSDSFWELLKPYKYISYTVNKSNAVTSSNVTASQIKKENEWVDLTVPWPTGGATGYFVYFIETDKRVRGYCNPAKGLEADGDVTKNFQFFIRPDYLYANRRIPMGITSSNGHLQVNPSSTAYREVIPVSYTDWENVASIMTARGVGSRPKLNYTGLNVSGISYKE